MLTVAGRDGAAECPFCPGAEASTPPECDAVRPDGGAGWTVRAFPNLYPAARWHEVIAEGPAHLPQPGELPPAIWCDALQLWRRRIAFIESQPDIAFAFLFKNVGRAAGASIAHPHSQIIGMAELPPRIRAELERAVDGSIVMPELVDAERERRIVTVGTRHVALCPRQSKLPFETWIAPLDPSADFDDARDDQDLAELMARTFRAIDRAFDGPPLNMWLHRVPRARFHWHFELLPRIGYLAGLELGADSYINSIDGVEAAARLRAAVEGGA